MSHLWYLRSHAAALTCDVLAVVFVSAFLPALGVGRDATILVTVVLGLLLAAPQLWEYLRERGLMRQLAHLSKHVGDAVEQAALLDEPGFPEGDATVGALREVARAAQREVGEARTHEQRYQRYVEAWVHEVKTPLAAMRLFLANHRMPELRPIRAELDRVEGYVEQALYYARSSSVERDYVVGEHELADLVRESVRSRSGELISARMSVDVGDVKSGLRVSCDAKWMAFVLGQIIDNAVRYRSDPRRDGRDPRLAFATRVKDEGCAHERVVLDVWDNGCGIPAADLGRVFDHGFTGDNGRTHARSTGMGLYLVRTLCERMGLAVGIESEPGVWTCVSIAFPHAKMEEAPPEQIPLSSLRNHKVHAT